MAELQSIFDAWNEADTEVRRRIVEAVAASDIRYDDVHKKQPIVGIDAFVDFLAFFRSRVSDAEMRADGEAEVLPEAARLKFQLLRNGKPFSAGTYMLALDGHGRISAMYGFIDKAPETP